VQVKSNVSFAQLKVATTRARQRRAQQAAPYQLLTNTLSRLTGYVALVSLRGTRLALCDAARHSGPLSIA
jgi:hypothetical protein